MLQDTLKTNVKKITLMFEVKQLNEEKVGELKKVFSSFKGEKALYVDVFDTEEKIKLTLPSRKQRLDINNELLSVLEQQKIPYQLN
jgi:DNA polymerase-3 subunit alpha